MKEKSGRRSFLKNLGIGGITASVAPTELLKQKKAKKAEGKALPQDVLNGTLEERPFNSVYKGPYLNRVAFPIGGLGAGMYCMEGSGAFSHMSVRHKPDVYNEPGMFAALYVKGVQNGAKVLEGPAPDWKKFGRPDSGLGSGGTILGFPRFSNAEFTTRFPFGIITLTDKDIPVKVTITGWSPFIPADPDNSSLPAGAMEYSFVNTGATTAESVFSFNSPNFMATGDEKGLVKKIDNGFVLGCNGTAEKPFLQGNFAIYTDQPGTVVNHCWFRGGWFDPRTIAWENIRSGSAEAVEPVDAGAPGASLYVPFTLAPGAKKTIRLMTAWYVPYSNLRVGGDSPMDEKNDIPGGQCFASDAFGDDIITGDYVKGNYKPWYSHRFKDIYDVAGYFRDNYNALHKK